MDMNNSTTYSVGAARNAFADILNRVAYSGEVVTIVKYGEPIAKLIPVSGVLPEAIVSKYFGIWSNKPWAKLVGKPSRKIRKNCVVV